MMCFWARRTPHLWGPKPLLWYHCGNRSKREQLWSTLIVCHITLSDQRLWVIYPILSLERAAPWSLSGSLQQECWLQGTVSIYNRQSLMWAWIWVSAFVGSSGNGNYSMTSRSALPHRTYLDEMACCTEEIHQFGLWSPWFWGFQACRVMKERWPRATWRKV